jgi:hypothetical protein
MERQVGATDVQIGPLVCELYGLMDGEVRIAEEATRRHEKRVKNRFCLPGPRFPFASQRIPYDCFPTSSGYPLRGNDRVVAGASKRVTLLPVASLPRARFGSLNLGANAVEQLGSSSDQLLHLVPLRFFAAPRIIGCLGLWNAGCEDR